MMKNIKQNILREERLNGAKNIDARRVFNMLLVGGMDGMESRPRKRGRGEESTTSSVSKRQRLDGSAANALRNVLSGMNDDDLAYPRNASMR